jgi:hypothetical protein
MNVIWWMYELNFQDMCHGEWIISIHPDGDYHFFLARDFSWGILGHPWEDTITIYGEKLVGSLLKEKPLMLHKVVKQG